MTSRSIKKSLSKVVLQEYRTYQIYTLMDRAIPYFEDGLKPVQRRILHILHKNQGKGLVKVSGATGMILSLHPHGPASIEAAITNLAQDYSFSNNYPLLDKKGYFGERMETSPAAGRYIECKLGDVAKLLLFDDLNQVPMTPNYDERELEPMHFLPKLPLMLLNEATGIGTGFSSQLPSYNHKDVISSMINCIEKGKPTKIKPWVRGFKGKIVEDGDRIRFHMLINEVGKDLFITDIPRGFDAKKIYSYLEGFIDKGLLKDFVDYSEKNTVKIKLVFKKGQRPSLKVARDRFVNSTSMTPNYTLIKDDAVVTLSGAEEIIGLFTERRLEIVKRRFELKVLDLQDKISKNKEIIRFIKEKAYEQATKLKNRQDFISFLRKKRYKTFEYLADMAIYRMTKEEVDRRKELLKEDKKELKRCSKIAKSKALVKKELISELENVKAGLDKIVRTKLS